jgi:fimbrial chaperone protein
MLRSSFYLIFAIFFSLLCSRGNASEVAISPVRLQLLPGEKITSFSLTNRSQLPMVVQLEAIEWKHDHGNDIHKETKKVIVTPPIAKILPNETQVVRAGLMSPADPTYGATYRVVIKELPQPVSDAQPGIQTLLEIRLPLLVEPVVKQCPRFTCSVKRSGPQVYEVSLENKGQSHFQISTLGLGKEGDSAPLASKDISDYLVPTQRKTWTLEVPGVFSGNSLQVFVKTDQGEMTEMAQLLKPGE